MWDIFIILYFFSIFSDLYRVFLEELSSQLKRLQTQLFRKHEFHQLENSKFDKDVPPGHLTSYFIP